MQVVEKYFGKFDADLVIDRMMNGPSWPRNEYTWPDGRPYRKDEIKEKWDNIGEFSRNRGTWMHYNIERFFNNLQPATVDLPEMNQFFNFKRDIIDSQGIKAYRTEWRIAAPEIGIAGSVDFIGQAMDGSYVIIDWKRAKALESNLLNAYGRKAK